MKRIAAKTTFRAAGTALLTVAGLAATLAGHADPTYSIFDLGTLEGGTVSEATCVNNSDTVSGWSNLGDIWWGDVTEPRSNFKHGFVTSLWNQMRDLNPADGWNQRVPRAINDYGIVVGDYYDFDRYISVSFWDWTPYNWIYSLEGTGNFPWCQVHCINNGWEMAGSLIYSPATPPNYFQELLPTDFYAYTPWNFAQNIQPFNAESQGLGPNYGETKYNHMNNYNQVVGEASLFADQSQDRGYRRAILVNQGAWVPTVEDIGTLPGGFNAAATCINDNGDIVGFSDGVAVGDPNAYTFGEQDWWGWRHAFLRTPNKQMTDIGCLPDKDFSEAYGINGAQTIVGVCGARTWYPGANRHETAFVYDPTNGMRQLDTLVDPSAGWVLNRANAVNESGAIVGQGTINGRKHAFMALPTIIKSVTMDTLNVHVVGDNSVMVSGVVTLSAPAACDLYVQPDSPDWIHAEDWGLAYIPAGQTQGTVYVLFTNPYNDNTTVPITFSLGGFSREVDFHISP